MSHNLSESNVKQIPVSNFQLIFNFKVLISVVSGLSFINLQIRKMQIEMIKNARQLCSGNLVDYWNNLNIGNMRGGNNVIQIIYCHKYLFYTK